MLFFETQCSVHKTNEKYAGLMNREQTLGNTTYGSVLQYHTVSYTCFSYL